MSINLSSNFDVYIQKPLEDRTVQATLITRDAIPSGKRHNGLRVFVESENKNYQLVGGITNSNWIEVVTAPSNGIFEWSSNSYIPYTVATAGKFDSGIVAPAGSTRLNYSGYLYATRLYDNNVRVSTTDHAHTDVYEPVLGAPSSSGSLLVSTTGKVRSWTTLAAILPKATINTLGCIKVGSNLTVDVNGVLNASGGAGSTNWGLIGGDITTQGDLMTYLESPTFIAPALGTPASGTLTNCTFPTLNQNTTGSSGSVVTTNFSIVQEGTGGTAKLVFKYGTTKLFSISTAGVITGIEEVTAFGTVA